MTRSENYESHAGIEADFPFIFHPDYLNREDKFLMHWHENIELLYFTNGRADILCDSVRLRVEGGDIAVVNPYTLHSVEAVSDRCEYYTLIVDRGFCSRMELPVGVRPIRNLVRDEAAAGCFERLIMEEAGCASYYKAAFKAAVTELLVRLLRLSEQSALPENKYSSRPLDMVRSAMSYIARHYTTPISVEEIAREVGYSKYYFCRIFKEITGRTVVVYINELRCNRARQLIFSGECNISESAERCGFHNLSYFTRAYKSFFGVLPSAARKEAARQALHKPQYVNPCVVRSPSQKE